ncbi:MAG: NrfD/PsrC family molybdoenzyme membrane anchor subunit [Candidatus Binatia bacterium]
MAAAQEQQPRPRPPVIEPGHTYGSITDKISDAVLTKRTPLGWVFGFAIGFCGLQLLAISVGYLFYKGIYIWGLNVPVGWGFDIINFVWWIGIGHAGTLISAILLLFRQAWRTSINRFAEAMTIFAVACAGMFPVIHTGRPWLAYWLLPYPNSMEVWPNFRSPLIWDVFAVSTYATVSMLFWFVGMIPDLATLRDRSPSRIGRVIYGMLAMGWRGSAEHWHRYETAYLLLAALSTPLVLSVHSVVSFDFAVSQVPGWHATIFPPYFVAGAIFAGFAMVMIIAIPLRKFYGLQDFITMRHFDYMARVTLATGLVVAYGYMIEVFMAFYSGNQFELALMMNRFRGPYAPFYWALILCNVIVVQLLWFRRIRASLGWLFLISIDVSIGMWLERFVIIPMSLSRDFLPSSWGMYYPTFWEYATLIGSMGLFTTLLFLFIRLLPMISIAEMRTLLPEAKVKMKVKAEGTHG